MTGIVPPGQGHLLTARGNVMAFKAVADQTGGDFSLMDRRVVDALNSLPENNRFVRGLRAWVGFRQTGVPYVRPERMFGRSTNNLLSNLRWARKGIFSFSYVPLEMISLGALLVSMLAILAIIAQIIGRILRPDIPQGVATIIVVEHPLGMPEISFTWWPMIGALAVVCVSAFFRTPDEVLESAAHHAATAQSGDDVPLALRE